MYFDSHCHLNFPELISRLDDIRRFRRNIVAFAKGSGASLQAFGKFNADAWITWPDWPVNHPELLESVSIAADRRIWRDLNVALSPSEIGRAHV